MKQLRLLGAACVLALMLAASASAGHIHTGLTGSDPSPSPTPEITAEATEDGSIAGHIEIGAAPSDSMAETTLSLVVAMLALF